MHSQRLSSLSLNCLSIHLDDLKQSGTFAESKTGQGTWKFFVYTEKVTGSNPVSRTLSILNHVNLESGEGLSNPRLPRCERGQSLVDLGSSWAMRRSVS